MAKCNALTLISFAPQGITPLRFAPSVDKINCPQRTMLTANAGTEPRGIVHIAKSAGLKVVEKIGLAQYMQPYWLQICKNVNFVALKNLYLSFMQTVVLRTEQKNTVVAASNVFLLT
jgi:hypothetical protein